MPRLEALDITMDFPSVRALDGVSLSFDEGVVHGIIGENGAGKSTLMRILSGLQIPTKGEIYSTQNNKREKVVFHNVRDALKHGIAMIHQELNLIDELTVAENIYLGREPLRGGVIDRRKMFDQSAKYLNFVHADLSPDILLGDLSLAKKQLVEIAKALSYETSILIMDEPTSVLSEKEAKTLFDLIGKLKGQGVAVIYVSHRLAEVEEICDVVSVLRDGKLVGTVLKGEASQADLANMMVGRPLGDMFPNKLPPPSSEKLLEVNELSDGKHIFNVGFHVLGGEIIGFAGLIGSGRTELAEILVGIRKRTRGEIYISEKRMDIKNPFDSKNSGVVYVSEDRKATGLHLELNSVYNTTLANLSEYAKPFLNEKKQRESCMSWMKSLDIRVPNPFSPIKFLSGGNQQKVSIAKWLETQPKILILDEPTRGVDVGAKKEIYSLIQNLSQKGMSCIVISSEMTELIGLCHRVYVMREGRIVGELTGDRLTEENIVALAAGVSAA